MRILIALFTLLTFAISASFAVARDANRDANWLIEKQQQAVYQQRSPQTVQPGGYWTVYQGPYVGTYPGTAPDTVRFYGN